MARLHNMKYGAFQLKIAFSVSETFAYEALFEENQDALHLPLVKFNTLLSSVKNNNRSE
jgi:hypothetical protein